METVIAASGSFKSGWPTFRLLGRMEQNTASPEMT